MTAQSALDIAAADIGYYAPDDPEPGSAAGRWLADKLNQPWLRGPSTRIWWCMAAVSMWVYKSGGTLPGGPQFNTDAATAAARAEGRLVSKEDARPGDVLIYDWNYNTLATDHTGLVEDPSSDSVVIAIEGNTSSGIGGSQSAGNGVYRRTRDWDDVRYVIRPYYDGSPTTNSATSSPNLKVDGWWGELTSYWLQIALGTPADKIVSSQDVYWESRNPGLGTGWEWVDSEDAEGSQLIEAIQRKVGATPDRLIGPDTISRIQDHKGTPVDGRIDEYSQCVMRIQKDINAGLGF